MLGKYEGDAEGFLLTDGFKLIDGLLLGIADLRLLGLSVGTTVGTVEGSVVGKADLDGTFEGVTNISSLPPQVQQAS